MISLTVAQALRRFTRACSPFPTLAGLCALVLLAPSLLSQELSSPTTGIAWRVLGNWRVAGDREPVAAGDAVPPGSLLQPGDDAARHSITLLLADGQRILYECYAAEDCARGFRVPPLYRQPEPFAPEMMTRIHAGLIDDRHAGSADPAKLRLPRDEAVIAFGADETVQIGGLATALPSGRYTYGLRSHADPLHPVRGAFEKTGPTVPIALPAPGLYVLSIADDQNTPRVDLFLAAVKPEEADAITQSFRKAKSLMAQWNEDYYGWPIHDFLRAYLASLVLHPKPVSVLEMRATYETFDRDSTREPAFSPKPGVFPGDTAVTLQGAPGATIHFTVDGSQPLTSSPIYHAPIMVKGTELTIKAFSGQAGRKDSAVVTGIFRIHE